MTEASTIQPSEAEIEAALDWYAQLHAPSADTKAWKNFAAWLEAAPVHRLAFDLAEDLHATLDGNAGQILKLLAAAPAGLPPPANENRLRWIAPVAICTAACLVAAGLAIVILPKRPILSDQPMAYAAPAGQARAITLADGSHVDLSPGSRIRVQFDASSRRVFMERGEALIQVGRDVKRPLVVLAGDLRLRDIGTQFDVALRPARVSVTVLSGHKGRSCCRTLLAE